MEEIEEIYHKYKRDVNNFLMYYMKTADVEDVFQETFINAFNALNKRISILNTRSWLITIARNTAIDFIRKRNRDKKSVLSLKTNDLHIEQHSIEEIIQMDETEKVLINGIDKLKKGYQEVVILRGIKEFSVAETAEILNWNENKVRITFHRAIKKLSTILEQEGDFFDYK